MTYDLAVIGAGPAGLATATTSADAGLRVAVLDAGPRIGGQYFRHSATTSGAALPGPGQHDWSAFQRLHATLERQVARGDVHHLARHRVWQVALNGSGEGSTPSGNSGNRVTVRALAGEPATSQLAVTARTLVVATGAYDRQLPFPGWDLPGVMAAGGVQALLKGDRVLAGKRIVVAGTGPFLLPVAAGLAEAGAGYGTEVAGVFEAGRPTGFARHPEALATNPAKLGEAASYGRVLARHLIRPRTRHAVVAAHGHDALREVTVARVDAHWRIAPGSEYRIPCDVLAVGYGFTPQLEIPLALGCDTRVDTDGNLVVDVDSAQATSVPKIYAAGETTGVGGAALSLVEGELAGFSVAQSLGRRAPGASIRLRRLLRRRRDGRRFAAALHDAYPVADGWMSWLTGDTIVCRCEEVPYDRVREAVRDLGATDSRTVKLLARPGMGWCQGRICGTATARLTADLTGRPLDEPDLTGLAHRPLAQPVPLGLMAEPDNQIETEAP